MSNTKIRSYILLMLLIIPTLAPAATTSPLSWKGYAYIEDTSTTGTISGSFATGAGRLTALYDTKKADWWKGGQFALGVIGIAQSHKKNFIAYVLQTASGYSATPEIRFTDLAYQHTFNDQFMVRAGIMDFDDYFNIMAVGINLLNTAFENTETLNLPVLLATYPTPGFGAFAQLGAQKLNLLLGVFQGNPAKQDTVFKEGQLVIAELRTQFAPKAKSKTQYTLQVGLWDYQQSLTSVGTTDYGAYVIVASTWRGYDRNLGASINFGINPGKFNTATDSVAFCFTVGGLIPSRPKDILSLGVASVWIGGAPHYETVYEVDYVIQLTKNITLIPDVEFFTHPHTKYKNAWVGILRLEYTIPT